MQHNALLIEHNVKTRIYTVYGQIYLLPYIKLTHSIKLNGDLELIIGWLKWEVIFAIQHQRKMKITPIRNEVDYQNALNRLEIIFDAKKGTEEGDELEILSILIERYEEKNKNI